MARLARANLLTAVAVPDEETEGVRDLLRARQGLVKTITSTKNRITSTLARHNLRCEKVKTPFTKTYRNWLLREVKLPTADGQLALEVLIAHLIEVEAQLKRVEEALNAIIKRPRYATVCGFLMAIHGVGPMVALGFLTSLQTPQRFADARSVMSYYGLVPDVCTSDGKRLKTCRITRRGDELMRWLLIQASWSYARPIRISKARKEALARLPVLVQERIAQMELRLHKRYRHLVYGKLKPPPKAVVAIAREMAGWLWAILSDLQKQGLVSFPPPEKLLPAEAA